MSIDTIVQEPDAGRALAGSGSPPPLPPTDTTRKKSDLYTRGLLVGIGLLGLYLTLQSGSKMITDIRIRRIEVYYGKKSATNYARGLWREIHPQQETVTGNFLNSGKKSAVLEYLGYRKLDGE